MSVAAQIAPDAGRYLDVAGIRTHFYDVGEGDPIVLLHGSGPGVSAWANWRLIIGDLAERARVIAPDQVGFGGTDPAADGRYGRSAWTAHAIDLIEHLGLARVSVVGNSMGGAIALSLAAARPDLIERIVLMGATGVEFPITEELDAIWGYTPDPERMRTLIEIFAYDHSIITDDLVALRYQQSLDPPRRASYEAMFPAPRQRWVDDLALDDAELRAIRQPVLLIHGFHDRVVPRTTSLRLMELLADADLHLIGRCGHWVQIEQATKFSALVRAFLTPDVAEQS